MTKITFQDGKPVMRDGKVGTGQGCCCVRGACCVDGVCDPTKATAEQCAASGGQWNDGRGCNDLCWCCSYRYICYEEVLIAKEGSWPRIQEGTSLPWSNDIDDIPTEQPPGTLFVWAPRNEGPSGNIYGCAGTPGIKMYANGSGETLPDGPCGEPGNYRFILQVYYRARIVDSCDECSGVEQEWEYPDGRVFCCDNDGNYHPNVTSCEDCPGWSPENINPARCWTTQGELLSARAGMSCSPLTQNSCANQIPNGDTTASPPLPAIPWSSCLEAAGISICANPFP